MNYQEIAYLLGVIDEYLNGMDGIKEQFTPDQDEDLARLVTVIDNNVKRALVHTYEKARQQVEAEL